MSQNKLEYLWESFEKVLCLTLNGDIERQKSATNELYNVGLQNFKFFKELKVMTKEYLNFTKAKEFLPFLHVFVVVMKNANVITTY